MGEFGQWSGGVSGNRTFAVFAELFVVINQYHLLVLLEKDRNLSLGFATCLRDAH